MLRLTIASAVLVLLLGVAGDAAPKTAKPRNVVVTSHLAGDLSFRLLSGAVEMTADGDGRAGRFGDISATATWAPALDRVLALLAGDIDSLTINAGTFSAALENGDTLSGTLTGTVAPTDDGFDLDAEFTVTGATGTLAGATGAGTLRAELEFETLTFAAKLHAKLAAPR